MTIRQLLPLVFAAACGPDITLTDDIDLTWDFGVTLSHFGDNLHTPYVRGAPVNLSVFAKDASQQFTGWNIQSSDPNVFQITSVTAAGKELSAVGIAAGEGTAELTVYDDHNSVVGSADADVLQPDRIELDAHAYLIMGMDDMAPVDELRVLANGEATYLVKYFAGNQELHGNGVLSVDPAAGVTAEPRTSFLFENREWLTVGVDPTATPQAIVLRADGEQVASLPLVVVSESDIDHVVMRTQSESGHHDGDWLVAYAQAYDSAGNRIFGVDYTWDIDGAEQTGDGDLYRYQYESGDYEMVTASRAGRSDAAMIQAEADTGYVDSSNDIGCSASGGGSGWLGGVAVLGLVGLRRRRRGRGGQCSPSSRSSRSSVAAASVS